MIYFILFKKMLLCFFKWQHYIQHFWLCSYRNIQYRHLLSMCFVNAVFGQLEMVLCYKWYKLEPDVCWKICKMGKVFGYVLGAYFFQCRISGGLKKWVRFLEWNIVKWVICFVSICWLWEFFLKISTGRFGEIYSY